MSPDQEMKTMKSLLLTAVIAVISFSAHAQTFQTYNNGFGSSTTYVNPGFSRRGW
jgi:hypothetical protein